MKIVQKIGLLAALVTVVASQAQAQVLVAYCQLGGGCKFYQTQYSYTQLDGMFNYLGTFEKDKGTLVFFKNKQNQDVHYPDRKRNPRELHAYFGGKGEPSIAKGNIAPFDEAIQPESGNWEATTETPTAKNCPPPLESQLKGIASVKSGLKNFKKPFSPAELLPPNTPWLTTTPNMYSAFLLPEANPSFKTLYEFEVKSPTLIKGTATIWIQIPTQSTCEMKTNFTFRRK
ncbi:MAG: hypothetical protein MUE30_03770 [Spirosomaceae bacterium]|nr:hypothetical protein [Spirosomataceae bacterium]